MIAPDLPGHGASGVVREPLDTAAVTRLAGRADRAHLPVAAGAGRATCSAAPIAARFAIDHPDRLGRLVLVDTYGLGRFWPAPRYALAMVAYAARPTEGTQERLFRQCVFDLDGLRERAGGARRAGGGVCARPGPRARVNAALKHLMPQLGVPAIPPAELARIAAPTTLIWGRHDRQVRLGLAEAASARYGWPLHVVERAADDPAVEQPEAFLQALPAALGSA